MRKVFKTIQDYALVPTYLKDFVLYQCGDNIQDFVRLSVLESKPIATGDHWNRRVRIETKYRVAEFAFDKEEIDRIFTPCPVEVYFEVLEWEL